MAVTSQSAKVTLPTDTQIKIEREFDAPAHSSTGPTRSPSWSGAGGRPGAAR